MVVSPSLSVRRLFTTLLAPFEELRLGGHVQYYVQTNATLLTDTWCELLAAYDIRVGVSVDGPVEINTERVDLRGKRAFDRIERGIQRLRDHGIPFSVISVVTAETINRPEELLDYLGKLGCDSAGFNIEEGEGVNTCRRIPTPEQADEFWRRTLNWTRSRDERLKVRELERLAEYLQLIRTGQQSEWHKRRLDPIPTVSVTGDVVLLSPELADTADVFYEDFHAGNVLHQPLTEIIDGAHRLRYVRDFVAGLESCRAQCAFFDFCRGAQAANRYFENGSLATTETNYCRVSRQALVTALSAIATKEKEQAT